jgi:sporulation protein YlmC with PRC-barrel domain
VKLRRHPDPAETTEIVVEAARDDELREHAFLAAHEMMAALQRLRTVKRRHERRRYAIAFGVAIGAAASAAALWRIRRHRDEMPPDIALPATPQWNGHAAPTTPAAGSPPARPVAPEAFHAESPDTQVGALAGDVNDLLSRRGQDVEDISGEKIGTLQDVYLDDPTGAPEWAVVSHGTFRTSVWFVPLRGVQLLDGRLQVPFTRQMVMSAPSMEAEGRISPNEEHELYHHYGVNRQEAFRVS